MEKKESEDRKTVSLSLKDQQPDEFNNGYAIVFYELVNPHNEVMYGACKQVLHKSLLYFYLDNI
jgi:hypothetical protein